MSFESESYQMRNFETHGSLINNNKHLVNKLEEQFISYPYINSKCQQVADNITFLHIGNIVHWCTHNVNYKQNSCPWLIIGKHVQG